MLAAFIGIFSALMIIPVVRILVRLLKQPDEKLLYGLILAGIGFLYVGFTWTDLPALISSSFQAVVFVVIACYGMVKNEFVLGLGYALHGCWDIAYHLINGPELVPPRYDLFCSFLDFVLAAYLLFAGRRWCGLSLKGKKTLRRSPADNMSTLNIQITRTVSATNCLSAGLLWRLLSIVCCLLSLIVKSKKDSICQHSIIKLQLLFQRRIACPQDSFGDY